METESLSDWTATLHVVGAPRFELGTSRTRTVRSTGLSHAPISNFYKTIVKCRQANCVSRLLGKAERIILLYG